MIPLHNSSFCLLSSRTFDLIIEDGELVSTEGSGYSYQFEFAEDANLFEGAQIELGIGGRTVSGNLTAILQGRIVITLSEDYGPKIGACILRIDNTALIQALHDRLQKIENGEVTTFRADFAAMVIKNEGDARPPAPLPNRDWGKKRPTEEQERFIRLAFANEISWLWGATGNRKDVRANCFHTAALRRRQTNPHLLEHESGGRSSLAPTLQSDAQSRRRGTR